MRIPRPIRAAVVAAAIAAPLGAPAASAGDIVIRRDGSKAVYVPPAAPPPAARIRPVAFSWTTPASALGRRSRSWLVRPASCRFAAGATRPAPCERIEVVVARFLVEAYTPATVQIAEVEKRARRAADHLAEAGAYVQYVRAIFVPEDELCMHLLDAASVEAASDFVRRAGISPDRIVEAEA
jgi:hypothetical protein